MALVQKSGARGTNEIRQWLEAIVRMLNDLPKDEEHKEKIKQWCIMRGTTVNTLEELMVSIQTWHARTLNTQLAGEVVSFVSDVVSLCAALLNIFGFMKSNTASSVVDCGKVGGIAGGTVSMVSSGAKCLLEQNQAETAKKVLKDDMTESGDILEFFKPSQELKKTVDEVLNFDLFCMVMDGFEKLYCESRNIYLTQNADQGSTRLPDDINQMIDFLPVTKEDKEKTTEVLTLIYTCYKCREHLKTIIEFRKEHPFVLYSACLFCRFSARSFLQRSASTVASVAAKGAIAASDSRFETAAPDPASPTSEPCAPSMGRGVIFSGAFAVVDIVNILATKKELDEKDTELVKRIREYAKIMKEELKVLKSFQEKYMELSSEEQNVS